MVKDISIEQYDYPLPENKIAKFPLTQRDSAKLLFFDGKSIKDEIFSSLPSLLPPDTLLIFNDTKVVYARLLFKKTTGSVIEIFCLEPVSPNDFQLSFTQTKEVYWKCLVGNNKKWKSGTISQSKIINGQNITLTAERIQPEQESWVVRFHWDGNVSFAEVMQHFGVIPLPPYLNRESKEDDKQDYQTVYAHFDGSVAAPTAGLHFSQSTFEALKTAHVKTDFVTLHVGAGTFKPVTTDTIGEHAMHTERISVTQTVVEDLLAYTDKNIICVGTTSVRTIESLYWLGVYILSKDSLNNCNTADLIDNPSDNQNETMCDNNTFCIGQWYPYECHKEISAKESLTAVLNFMKAHNIDSINGRTRLIIAPSYRYRIVSGMVTNFHQPKSTLLLLVSAMIGDNWKKVYQHALDNDYRFLSYGDACLFLR